MWNDMNKLPTNEDVIVQTNRDVYQCRIVDGELNWPGRYTRDENEQLIRWTEDACTADAALMRLP